MRGKLHTLWYQFPAYDRSSVSAAIELDETKKEEFERAAKVKLKLPPKIQLA